MPPSVLPCRYKEVYKIPDMRKIPETLREIITSNPTLEFGFAHNLFNLTQLARFLQPLVQARASREVSVSALSMALSRLGTGLPKGARPAIARFKFKNLAITGDLVVLTLPKEADTHKSINQLYSKLAKREGHFTVTEGLSQVTIIIEEKDLDLAQVLLDSPSRGGRPQSKPAKAASISVSFDPKYLSTPGFLYVILQQLALQGINILELSSTATELILYVKPSDVTLAFDTLYERFMRSSSVHR